MSDLFVLFEAKVDLECPKNIVPQEKICFHHRYLSESKNYKNLIFSGLRYVITAKYDCLILHTWYTCTQIFLIIILKILKKKYWIETDGNSIDYNENKLKKLFKSFLFKDAEGIFSSSINSDEYFIFYGVNKEKIHRYTFTSVSEIDVLPKNFDSFSKWEIRKNLGIEKNKKVILAVGRFIPRKGFDVLIKACTTCWDVYFVGGKPTNDYLRLTKDMGLENNVHFVNYCSKTELSNYYKAADIFVLPTRYDSWGLVVNEAMSYGLPVVTTDCCGAGLEVLDHQHITIVPSDNAVALNHAISTIFDNEELRIQLGNRNLEYAREHTIEKMVRDHICVFDDKG